MCMQENRALCQPQDLAWWKAQNQNQKEVQTCTQAKWQKTMKPHAQAQCLHKWEHHRWVCASERMCYGARHGRGRECTRGGTAMQMYMVLGPSALSIEN